MCRREIKGEAAATSVKGGDVHTRARKRAMCSYVTQLRGIVRQGTLLLPRLSCAYRSVQAAVSRRRRIQWRPFSFHSSFFSFLFLDLFLSPHPTWSCSPPRNFWLVETHPLLHLNSSHCPLARYTPRSERILPRHHSRFTPLHPPNARVDESSTFPLFDPLLPRVPHTLFTRPGKQRHDAFTTKHSYNRLTHLTRGRRNGGWKGTRGGPSTNDLENLVVLGPLDRLSRLLAAGDPERSRSISGPENCTSRTDYARNGERTPRHSNCLPGQDRRDQRNPFFVEFERHVATTISARLKNDGIRPVIYPAHSDPQSRARASATPGPFPSCLPSSLSLPFSLFSASFRCPFVACSLSRRGPSVCLLASFPQISLWNRALQLKGHCARPIMDEPLFVSFGVQI